MAQPLHNPNERSSILDSRSRNNEFNDNRSRSTDSMNEHALDDMKQLINVRLKQTKSSCDPND